MESRTYEFSHGEHGTGLAGCVLYVAQGVPGELGLSLKVNLGEALIGTGEACELRLTDPSVSAKHFRIIVRTDGLEVIDLDSTNGTRYLGNKFSRILLEAGARLELGNVLIDVIPLSNSSLLPAYSSFDYGSIIGASSEALALFAQLKSLESTEAPVMLASEAGLGAEEVALNIHKQGARSQGPFAIMECQYISDQSLNDELYGRVGEDAGIFEEAKGGTLFIDSVDKLSLDGQQKLLQIVASQRNTCVGDTQEHKIDVRLVTSSQEALDQMVLAGGFRVDLYMALGICSVEIPSLSHFEELPTDQLLSDFDKPKRAGCVLYVVEGATKSRTMSVTLESGEVVIGSGSDCDLVLQDASVSRSHLRILVQERGIEVHDLNSTNGTRYLNNRVSKITMEVGGRLVIGESIIDIVPLSNSTLAKPFTGDCYGKLVGTSSLMRALYGQLEMLEKTDAPILIFGETGTGKELIAHAVHQHSARADKPYLVVDCSNIAKDLIGSELFGHVEGAFTGAVGKRLGVFEEAEGGTVFLDEIGELPSELQSNLLRVIESGQIKPLGQSAYKKVDVRIVAATHRDLSEEVARGSFREDLYFRLSVFRLCVPALRDRLDDLAHLTHELQSRMGLPQEPLSSVIQNRFMCHQWPGNVRELRNALQRAHILGEYEHDEEGTNTFSGIRLFDSELKSEIESTPPPALKFVEPLIESNLNTHYAGDHYGELVGQGSAMSYLFGQLKLLEKTNASVLIHGETGTGKELIAQALHDHSERHTRPYLVVDCANLAKDLIGSELFGHVKGAYTGASSARAGAFEEAGGGTIFLDEIGELPLELQSNLLRVLESGQIKRLGQSGYRRVDVRIIAATHRDLKEQVVEGTFREDLYFRMSVFTVTVPPLRERVEDLPLLIDTLQKRMDLDVKPLSNDILTLFSNHTWPGNIRELRNSLQRFHIFGEEKMVKGDNNSCERTLNLIFDTDREFNTEKKHILGAFEATYLEALLKRSTSISEAAREAGLTRRQIRDLLKKHDLYESSFQSTDDK
jgi:DNA-binding NtrC family response regulator